MQTVNSGTGTATLQMSQIPCYASAEKSSSCPFSLNLGPVTSQPGKVMPCQFVGPALKRQPFSLHALRTLALPVRNTIIYIIFQVLPRVLEVIYQHEHPSSIRKHETFKGLLSTKYVLTLISGKPKHSWTNLYFVHR